MVSDVTVVYYTANQESPVFEDRIRSTLRDTIRPTGIPLISVSQQPLDFGHNICVGDVGVSSQNAWTQLQVGAATATTRYIVPAEADCIYPASYFTFQPERDDTFYVADPVWVLFCQRGYGKVFYRKHRGCEAAIMVGRDTLLRRLELILGGYQKWGLLDADGKKMPWLMHRRSVRSENYQLDSPVLTFKTDRNMHRKTPHDELTKTRFLEPFGNAREFVSRYLDAR